jgi:RNA polymerase-binding transcription factor DksA
MSRIYQEARTLLLGRRERLSRHLVETPHADPEAHWHDWESAAEPLSEEMKRELGEIENALRRLEEGRYGMCVSCGGPMGLQRMRAIPEARYCMACSGVREAE